MTGAGRKAANNAVHSIPLSELYPFPHHPFSIRDDDEMLELTQSIQERGVLVPAIVRRRGDGGYEIISGHRRKRGCELAKVDALPAIIVDLDHDAAIIAMVDSNLQREYISPSERAKAYKMKLEAIKRQGARNDLTSRQNVGKLEAADIVGKDIGKSGRQIQRYIHLTDLIPPLLSMVDNKEIAVSPAIELSFLKPEEQSILLDVMDAEQAAPSLSQAQRLKKLSGDRLLTFQDISSVLSEEKKCTWDKVTLCSDKLRAFFPDSYTPRQMEDTIWRLLEMWQKNQNAKKAS